MTGLTASSISARFPLLLLLLFALLAFNELAHAAPPLQSDAPTALLLEAKGAATSIDNLVERSAALDPIIVAQIAIDPPAARETLKIFPKSPQKLQYFTALAAAYAETGNIAETERMYADIVVEDQSSRPGKVAAANALGQVAIAYAIKGRIEEASNTLSRVKERAREERLPIIGIATARLVEAQARQGDIRGAVHTALTILEEDPAPFMRIVRDRSGNAQQLQEITASLDEGAQPYAQWAIMQAQIHQGRLMDAQVTASAIKPGRARAGALSELATYHIAHGTTPLALVLLQEAEASARASPHALASAESLQHIAVKTAMAGDAGRATSIARSIEKDGPRRAAIRDIVKAQSKRGEFADAFNTASLLKSSPPTTALTVSDYEMAISEILVEMVKSGKGTQAQETAARFQDTDIRRSRLYSGIAAAYADIGKLKEAQAALALAETEAQRSSRRKELRQIADTIRLGHDPPDQARFQELMKIDADMQGGLDAIAKALARKGDLNRAIAVADELNQPAHRLQLIKELSTLHVQAGRKEQTLRWARTLSSAPEKVFALVGISNALALEADKRKAKPASYRGSQASLSRSSPERAGHNQHARGRCSS